MKHKKFKYFPTWRSQVLLALALLSVLSPFDRLEAQHKARNEENKKEQAPPPMTSMRCTPILIMVRSFCSGSRPQPESNRWMGHNSLRRSLIGYFELRWAAEQSEGKRERLAGESSR